MELEQNIEHALLRHIRPYQITFKIRVRASRLWRPKKYYNDIYGGLHYLLIDEEGHAIHGLIEEYAYPYMSNKMEEGQVYDITNFYNRKPISKYKVADHVVELCFNESTKFEPVMDAFPPIPEHSFNFLHFDNLEDQMRTQTLLKDVYGCIKSLRPEHQVTVKDTEKLESKCEIFVENLRREDIRITFWGDIARKFDMERVKQLSPPVLAVFTGLRLTKFQERVTAATTGHTCIIINPDIPIANEYKAERQSESTSCTFQTANSRRDERQNNKVGL
ncbi:uncharacterized protein LOC112179730 isoform X1 [Rosa chinensis]|uniref:uncharacterized protein LOC112179730 isoform X1 n=1 Tax=Rosa chinensis TaxID=74649 RepID=UPI001AD9166A|nr:uncharacterized protein LOC112179730 isoform X1 [Rosa chinensis]XP_040366210.1 uncharacterized protein LOC112179730 isoform X1 [Rosa chinensis]XP_040366212.1 uncharacterized protein LOC112179730 isoform X1 [Rosa chinensis]XP_040366213.1 uncharacterized protein LOC112179730 isoform X1 [Rosa chinensis]XP_040366214.1 uncharacterized protein LOC112179730 isoform X1 [Rosa chinensis]XP_040366215.1 uncharacterized protein LOC112179730 isoform X1 [Rosa chinensis]